MHGQTHITFKVAITEMHPLIPWEIVADPLGSEEQTFGTIVLDDITERILKISTLQSPALATFSFCRIRQPEEIPEINHRHLYVVRNVINFFL
jgi:hypothetical protein